MEKFNRNYILKIQTNDLVTDQLTVTPPFTLNFSITRNTLSSANVCTFSIYNLSRENRDRIFKDQYDVNNLRKILFMAGYGKHLSICFSGNIIKCYSVREGTNFVTHIECFDAGYAFANAELNKNYPSNTPMSNVVSDMVSTLKQWDVQPGAISDFDGVTKRGSSYAGSTTEILRDLTGGAFFIDMGTAYALRDSDAILGEVQEINSETGLLGTPIKQNTFYTFEMIFEPRLKVGQVLNVNSTTEPKYNGKYKVVSIQHTGTISDAQAGTAITKVEMIYGSETLRIVR